MSYETPVCRECKTEYPASNIHRRGCKTAKRDRAERAARLERAEAASADERARFNAAIKAGAVVMLDTFNGPYAVEYVTHDFRYFTPRANGGFGMHWAGCNDGTWRELLKQAGVARNRLWENS